jgi:pyruvate-formate lyase
MALPTPEGLSTLGEHLAAGYYEEPDASPMIRWSRAVRRRFERRKLTVYRGTRLYPTGPHTPEGAGENRIVQPSFSFTWLLDEDQLNRCLARAEGSEREILERLGRDMRNLHERVFTWHSPHTVGGHGYTHSIPNYGRVLREGLDEYVRRIHAGLADAQEHDGPKIDFYLGLQDVVEGIRCWHRRIAEYLESWMPRSTVEAQNRDRLIKALRRVPFGPARTTYEAILAYNFVYYLDDCDNPGRLDRELYPYYRREMQTVRPGRGDTPVTIRKGTLDLLREFTDNVCDNGGWSAAIGGSLPDGAPAYNDLTILCLEAVYGKYRPSYELAVRPDMPDEVWDRALQTVGSGCGQPAFYNERAYQTGLRQVDLGLSGEDIVLWNGGGCTETMIHGCSNVGSLDAGIHLPLVLEGTLQECLPTATTFQTVMDHFKRDVAGTIQEITCGVSRLQEAKARLRPQPMRSLLIDDCIDRGIEYNAGGARYNWSVVNVAGLSNVADSLAAVREVVFETGEVKGVELLDALTCDFEGSEALRQRLMCCPRYGNDQPTVDEIAADIAQHVFAELRRHVPWRGGRFLPSCIMFTTYAREGAKVGATPDGRRAGEPLGDSIGPVAGRDRHGPTAMIKSVTRLPLQRALGTPVLNVRFNKELFDSNEGRQAVRDLIRTYFGLGGMQIQISVLDQAVLRDAIAHPERHEDLIVRVGGFSAYFNSLSLDLRRTILDRTEHALSVQDQSRIAHLSNVV